MVRDDQRDLAAQLAEPVADQQVVQAVLELRDEDRHALRPVGVGDAPAHLVAAALDREQASSWSRAMSSSREIEVDALAEDAARAGRGAAAPRGCSRRGRRAAAPSPRPGPCGRGSTSSSVAVGVAAHRVSRANAWPIAMQAWRAVRPLRVPRSSAKRSARASSSAVGHAPVECRARARAGGRCADRSPGRRRRTAASARSGPRATPSLRPSRPGAAVRRGRAPPRDSPTCARSAGAAGSTWR